MNKKILSFMLVLMLTLAVVTPSYATSDDNAVLEQGKEICLELEEIQADTPMVYSIILYEDGSMQAIPENPMENLNAMKKTQA
jgi:hypothetical protein